MNDKSIHNAPRKNTARDITHETCQARDADFGLVCTLRFIERPAGTRVEFDARSSSRTEGTHSEPLPSLLRDGDHSEHCVRVTAEPV
jgi:hypothetical protein